MTTLATLCRRRKVHFWGSDYFVTPRLVNWIHGDGLQVIAFTPLNTRPKYYVARIDSQIDLDNCGYDGDCFCDEVLEQLYEAIENQFGRHWDTWEHDNGRTYTRRCPFPALNEDSGSAWEFLVQLERKDERDEAAVRSELAFPMRAAIESKR